MVSLRDDTSCMFIDQLDRWELVLRNNFATCHKSYKKVMVRVFLLNFSASNRLVNRCSCFVIGISLPVIISKVFK